MTVREFKEPEEIKDYGRMVVAYDTAMKSVAYLRDLHPPAPLLAAVVGDGPYNSLAAQLNGYTLYGKEQMEQRKNKFFGMFEAFYLIHLPELRLARQAPKLLGKAGCKLKARVRGQVYSIPLDADTLQFDFVSRTEKNRGYVTLRNAISLTEDGSVTLPAGTPLTPPDIPIRSENYDPKRTLNKRYAFQLVDANDKPIEQRAANLMLWGHIGSFGIKKHGGEFDPVSQAKFNTIGLDGTDDDVAAERHMVQWMQSLQSTNRINLMPAFNHYVSESSAALNNRADLLQALALGQIAIQQARSMVVIKNEHYVYISASDFSKDQEQGMKDHRFLHRFMNKFGDFSGYFASRRGDGIGEAVRMLDLNLPSKPPYSADVREAVGKPLYPFKAYLRDMESLREAYDFVKKSGWDAVIYTLMGPHGNVWEYESKAANLPFAIGGDILRIARKIVQPAPEDGPDVRQEVERIRRDSEAFESFYQYRPSELQNLEGFLKVMDECNCNLENLRERYLHHDKSPPSHAARVGAQAAFAQRVRTERAAGGPATGM